MITLTDLFIQAMFAVQEMITLTDYIASNYVRWVRYDNTE
jgi:hypothetical protein